MMIHTLKVEGGSAESISRQVSDVLCKSRSSKYLYVTDGDCENGNDELT